MIGGTGGPVCLALLMGAAVPVLAAPTAAVDRLHGLAVHSFRQGRFPDAYGRFVELANLGHPASARYALWMCEQGPALFGKDWDCAPHEVADWALAAGVSRPLIAVRVYAAPAVSARSGVRR